MLAELLVNRVVGPIHIGQSKGEVLAELGPPSLWDGKPGTILDKGISSYNASNAWIYNGIFVVLREGIIDELNIWIEYPFIDLSHGWFKDWCLPRVPKISDIIAYLDIHHIPFTVTPTKSGSFGCNLVLSKGYILGAPLRNPILDKIDVYGIIRVNDHRPITATPP